MTTHIWKDLLNEARALHAEVPALAAFCAFPDAVTHQPLRSKHDPLCDRMAQDPSLAETPFAEFRDACLAAAPYALWRDTYRDTHLGAVLHANFGTFEILGRDTPLGTDAMRGFLVYQRAGYHYPLHFHPAEEIYLVLAGQGDFTAAGQPDRTLRPGDTQFHASNQPHALTTTGSSILAYVLWRGELGIKPVWSDPGPSS